MRNQKGCPLLEIVMVLVLIGILASMAVPKYFDLQDSALQKAASASAAEARSRLNTVFGEQLLSGSSCNSSRSKAIENTSFADNGKPGDFTAEGGSRESGDAGSITLKNRDNAVIFTTSLVLPVCGTDQYDSVQQASYDSSSSISGQEDNQESQQESLAENQETTASDENNGESHQQQTAYNQDCTNNDGNFSQDQQVVADNQNNTMCRCKFSNQMLFTPST